MIDNEGRKIVREKGSDGNEQNATHYFNMSEGTKTISRLYKGLK